MNARTTLDALVAKIDTIYPNIDPWVVNNLPELFHGDNIREVININPEILMHNLGYRKTDELWDTAKHAPILKCVVIKMKEKGYIVDDGMSSKSCTISLPY